MTTIQNTDDTKRSDANHDIILSLNLDEEIIQFNKESEHLTGYRREEVLYKKLSEILVPEETAKQWKDLFDSIRKTMWVDNFILPIKTKNNQTYMITWTGFLVKDEKGTVKDICIFGKPQKTEIMTKQSLRMSPEKASQLIDSETQPKTQIFSNDTSIVIQKQHNREASVKHGVKKIMFASEKKTVDERAKTDAQEQLIKPLVTMGKLVETTSQKLDVISKSLKDLSQKYETITHRVAELEKKDRRGEKKHKPLDAPLQSVKEDDSQSTKSQKDLPFEKTTSDEQLPNDAKYTFFSDPFGFKRQSRCLNLKKQQVDIRIKELEVFEAQLMKERSSFNARVEEFSRWRDKLLLLESAIEKRRQELMKQEDIVFEQSTIATTAEEMNLAQSETLKDTEQTVPRYDDETFDKIPQSAAIIQRGILKQINNPFLELLGYTTDDLVEKSFFDFIAFEGLADVEKYYLDRLKGDSVTVYKTVFSTKDNNKIPVEVNIKQTIYNGEKAEIVIITCLDKQDSQQVEEHDVIRKQ